MDGMAVRSQHGFAFLAVCLAIALAGAVRATSAPRATSSATATNGGDPLAGRLGGTLRSFAATYGAPVANGPSGVQYGASGLGLVAVQFRPPGALTDRALVIVLRAPRPAAVPALTPDAADWTLPQAEQIARRFLPGDVQLGPATDVDTHDRVRPCTSRSLEAVFARDRSAGLCRVGFVMPTASTVSFVTLTLSARVPVAATATIPDPCAGLAVWGQATGQRLQTATALLRAIGQLPANDGAATQLRQAAQQFAVLAAAQRTAAVPPAAAQANARLVAVFDRFQGALSQAADALARQDATAARTATAAIAGANSDMGQATALMRAAFAQCGLAVATPVP